jgi:YD repeat-containing protein
MRAFFVFVLLLLLGSTAYAAETITYSYDARGRLIQVARTGTVNNNVTTNYTYDKADNRSNKTTTGSPNPPPP